MPSGDLGEKGVRGFRSGARGRNRRKSVGNINIGEIKLLTPLRAAFAASLALAEPALGFAAPNHHESAIASDMNSETRKSCCSCGACPAR